MKAKDKMIGAGIGLAALAAAGTYFLRGKRGAKKRDQKAVKRFGRVKSAWSHIDKKLK